MATDNSTRQRETTLKVSTVVLVVACLLVVGALLWDGVRSRDNKQATLGNRAVALNNTWLACMNYQALHPGAPVEAACRNLPAHTVSPPPGSQSGGND